VLLITPPAPRGTVFVLHGVRDHKESMIGWGRALAAEGYRAVLVDARGHGRSSGDYLSYGVVEARDLGAVLDALAPRGPLGRVGAFGVSYGAATAIEWAGVDSRVSAVVAVAPFASLRAVVPGYARLLVPGVGERIPAFLLARAVARAGIIGAFDPEQASPSEAASRTRAPILLVHGGADQHIPPSHSEVIHARALDHSEVILVPGEDHVSITGAGSGRWWGRAVAFLSRALAPRPD
jgi:pimeloyl-ACP methyl ester carboxylesterase